MAETTTLTAIFEAQDRLSDTLAGIDRRATGLSDTFKKVATSAAAVFSTAKIVNFGLECANAANVFETGMKEVYTLLPNISGDALGRMSQDVKKFSIDMGVLPEKTVPALYQALSAGIPKGNVFDFMEEANKAAIGGVTSVETAVDGLSSIMNAYGQDAIDVGKASDIMFTTIKLGKTTFDELAGNLYNVLPTAVGAGVAFEDISASLAAMTAQGIPTGVATTQLRQAIVELSKSGTETDEVFQSLAGKGFKQFIAEGRTMQEAFIILEDHAIDTGVGINDLFGSVEAGNAVLSLTGQGSEKFTAAMDEMQIAAGATDEAFATMEDSMGRKLEKMEAAWEVTKINLGNIVVDALLPVFEFVADNIDVIGDGVDSAFNVIGDAIENVWDVAKPMLIWVKKNPDILAGALVAIGTSIITYKVASGIVAVASAVKTFNFAMIMSPIGIVAALATAVVGIGIAFNIASERMQEADLNERFGDVTLSLDEVEDVVKRLVREDTFGKLEESMRVLDEIENLASGMQESIDLMNNLNWKVSVGLGLSEDEKESYQTSVASFIGDTQSLLEREQYSLSLAIDFFMGETEMGSDMQTNLNTFFANYQKETAELGKEFQDEFNTAFEEGLLEDTAMIAKLDNLQKQMIERTNAISDAKLDAKMDFIGMQYSGEELTPESYIKMQDEMQKEVDIVLKEIETNYINASTILNMELKEGVVGQEEFNEQKEGLNKLYDEQVINANLKPLNFQLGTIQGTYEDVLVPGADLIVNDIKEEFQRQMDTMDLTSGKMGFNLQELIFATTDSVNMTDAQRENIQDLFEQMKPRLDELVNKANEYVIDGEKVPGNLTVGIMDTALVGAFAGDAESIELLIGSMFSQSDTKYTEMLNEFYKGFGEIPVALATSIDANKELVTDAAGGLLEAFISRMTPNSSIEIPITFKADIIGNDTNMPSDVIPGYATGTLNAENIFVAGEEGPELIIGARGSTVFPHSETDRILGSMQDEFGAELALDYPQFQNNKQDGYFKEDKNITIEIKGSGSINSNSAMSKEDVVDVMVQYVRPVLINILNDEMFEEGDFAYDY